MKRLLAVAMVAMLAFGAAISSQADQATPNVQRLERRIEWQDQHIRQLNHRRAYLHRYIKGLRVKLHPASSSTHTITTSTASPSTASSGPLRISPATAADAMRSAGFPESVIPYFLTVIIPRESGFCPTAVYPGHCGDVSYFRVGGAACSLFQLYTCPGPQAADPYVAARYAYSKYQASGLAPWGG